MSSPDRKSDSQSALIAQLVSAHVVGPADEQTDLESLRYLAESDYISPSTTANDALSPSTTAATVNFNVPPEKAPAPPLEVENKHGITVVAEEESDAASMDSSRNENSVKRRKGARSNRSRSTAATSVDMLPVMLRAERGEGYDSRWSWFTNAFDWRFVLTILDPREFFWPMTLRRALFLIGYAGIAVGLYFLDRYYRWAHAFQFALRYKSWIAMGLIYGLEPVFMLTLYLIARLPHANRHLPPPMCERCLVQMEEAPKLSNTETTALVIPCHNSDMVAFFNVLQGALKHFAPEQIYVVENGNSPTPPNRELHDFCMRIAPDIQYIWSPIASKNAAQYVGTLAAHGYEYIITIDDDVVLPWNYRSPTEMITDETRAVAFPIGARVARQQSWAGADSLVVSWQDIEFKGSGLVKTAEAQLCGVLYPHGAVSFWERTTLLECLRIHSLVFYGEDTQLGFALQKLGLKLTIDASIVLHTEVPASFLGPPLNYYRQRVRSWEMARLSMVRQFVTRFFALNGQRTVTGFIAQKLLQFYALYSILADLLRVPLFVVMGSRPGYWQKFALFALAPMIPALVIKFIKARHRPDYEPALIPCLTYPVYNIVYQIVACLGALRCIFWYWPTYKHTKTIVEWERENVFWLDERFLEDPGYLGRVDGDGAALAGTEGAAAAITDEKRASTDDDEDVKLAAGKMDEVAALSYHGSRHTEPSRFMVEKGKATPTSVQEQRLARLEGQLGRIEHLLLNVSRRV